MTGHETKFLQDTVGSVLAQGCSVVAAVKPSDPVEYLGLWLLQYVRNAQIEGKVLKERGDALLEERNNREKEANCRKEELQLAESRKNALDTLPKSVDNGEVRTPVELWDLAVKLVTEFTSAKSAYVAAVMSHEEPDAELEEDDNETDDEQDRAVPAVKPSEGEQDEEGGENEAEAETQGAAETGEEQEKGQAPPPQFDYSKKFLQYIVGSAAQEFVQSGDFELHRPPPREDGEEEEGSPQATSTPPTFRILDEQRPSIYIQNCLTEKGVHFLRKIPRVGSYFSCALQSDLGEYKAILGSDTLIPPGNGGPLEEGDRDFIWRVAQAVGKLSDVLESRVLEGSGAKEDLDAMKAEIAQVYSPKPAEETPSETEKPEDSPPAEAGEEEQKQEEAEDDEEIKALKEALHECDAGLSQAQSSLNEAEADLDREIKVLDIIKTKISGFTAAAVAGLRCFIAPPKATFKVLKSVLYMIGWPTASFLNWKVCRQSISCEMFDSISVFDPTGKRNPEVWKDVRKSYKAVSKLSALESELPDTCMGVLLLMMVKQVRRIARRVTKKQEALAVLKEKEDQRASKGAELEEKTKEKEAKAAAEKEAQEQAGDGGEKAAEE